jgi:hypothetical protein
MGNLRDQLKNAKLLSDKEARRLAHEERAHRKEVGREGLEQEERERQAEVARLRAEQREQAAAAQAMRDRERQEAAERAACAEILKNEVVQPRGRGGQRWYFELEDGSLPWFEVEEAMRFQLQSGAFWVVRIGAPDSHAYGLLPAALGARVVRAMPHAVAWVPGGPRALAAVRRG